MGVDGIVVVAHPDSVTTMAGLLEGIGKVEAVVPGGSTRSASTLTALDTIEHADGLVLVHDAARPLVTSELISAVLAALASADAATVAVPADDTMLRVHDGAVIDIPDRSKLWHAQTPQGFRLETLRAAYRAAGNSPDFTDDCSIVARHLPGVAISVVPGSPRNLKITHPGDIAAAERFSRRKQQSRLSGSLLKEPGERQSPLRAIRRNRPPGTLCPDPRPADAPAA